MADTMTDTGNKPTTGAHPTLNKAITTPSPPSGNSSETLHDNESTDDERNYSNFSPLSTTTLNFEDLKIHDADPPRYLQEHTDRFAGAFHGDFKTDYSHTPTYSHHARHFGRINPHLNSGHAFARGSGNHRNARTWVSEETRAAQEFLTVRNSMRRMFKNADVAKWKVADFIAHGEAVMASGAKRLAQQVQDREAELNFHVAHLSTEQQNMMRRCGLFGNFEQVGNYSRALGEKTIWCQDWQNGKDEIAPWPCLAEMKWEGDDRAKTGVGRYPPLPREQGPVGLPWNQLQAVEQYPLDRIAHVPTMEDVYLPVDEIDDEVKYDLLNKDLEDAINFYLDS